MAERREVIDQEFGPELAGARVGWVNVGRGKLEEGREADTLFFDMAIATVGEEGAALKHLEYDDEPGKRLYSNVTREGGFSKAVTVSGITPVGDQFTTYHQMGWDISGRRQFSSEDTPATTIVRRGSSMYDRTNVLADENRQWFTDVHELPSLLRGALATQDLEESYPLVYYMLNMVSAHDDIRPADGAYVEPNELLVADPLMQETTLRQEAAATNMAKVLASMVREDEKMLQEVTDFSGVMVSKTVEAFRTSRRAMAEKESEVTTDLEKLVTPFGVYTPLGQGRAGRTWPYMDASEEDERCAFGLELEALQAGFVERPKSELKDEIKETSWRRDWAQKGALVLSALARQEAAIATADAE